MEFMALWGLSDFVFNVLAGKFRITFGPGWAEWMVVWHERLSSLDTPPIYDQPSLALSPPPADFYFTI